jgi:surface-anchored protein
MTYSRNPTRTRLAIGYFAAAAAALTLSVGSPVASWAQADPLDQTIDSEQAIAADRGILTAGHIDIGPRIIDGEFTLLIHDDVAKADPAGQSVWRQPDQTVIHVTDAAVLPVPDDPAYAFLGVPAGDEVFVVPQTQNPDVVWVGWNTQDPDVMDTIDRGVTMSLVGVDGPGDLIVYLQSGTFGEPDVLWDSRVAEEQRVWVDVNTHTHANWVFTQPGTYLAQFQVEADLIDGNTVTDTQTLRFAVGGAADIEAAFAAESAAVAPGGSSFTGAAGVGGAGESTVDTAPGIWTMVLIAAIVLTALLLVIVLTLVLRGGNRAKRRAVAAQAAR